MAKLKGIFMDGSYRTLSGKSLESNILFWGQENCKPNYSFKGNNVRDNYVIHYIQKGKGTFASANHSMVSLKAGDVFILPKGVPCFYQADGQEPWSYFWLGLSGIKIRAMLSGSLLSTQNYLKQVQGSKFCQSLNDLFNAAHSPNSLTNDILIGALLYFTFYNLNVEYPTKKRKNSITKDEQLRAAITYLRQNFDNPNLSIVDLCNKMDISRSYLYTLFKNNLSFSPQQFLINLRMENAKEFLANTDDPIQLVSRAVGYSDEFTFSKAFKRYSGFSPKMYRQSLPKQD